jgi:hypothetical protein
LDLLESFALAFTSAAARARQVEPQLRFPVFFVAFVIVCDQAMALDQFGKGDKSPDDPLLLFLTGLASLELVFQEPLLEGWKRALARPNWGVPAGLDPTDTRSRPLFALHLLIDVIKETVDELARSGGRVARLQ